MFCSNCGKEIDDSSKFCRHCGYSVGCGNLEKMPHIISGKIKNKSSNDVKAIGINLLVAVLLIVYVLCNFIPIVKTESYLGRKDYNITSFTKEILYNEYSFSFYGTWSRGEDYYTWPANGGVVSVFDYIHAKSIHIGDQSYDETMEILSSGMYISALILIVINSFLVIISIIRLIKNQLLSKKLLDLILFLEILRLGFLLFDIISIINLAPDVFRHKDYWLGGYEVAVATMYPFYLPTIVILIFLQIIYHMYYKRFKVSLKDSVDN